MSKKDQGFSTKAIHAGQDADPATGATVVPIYATSTYTQAAPGQHKGYEYSRSGNPTRTALETCLAALEGGERGLAFASGLAATTAVLAQLQARRRGRGGGRPLRRHLPPARTRLQAVGPRSPATPTIRRPPAFASIITPTTKLVWIETPTNPLLQILDIAAIADLAHKAERDPGGRQHLRLAVSATADQARRRPGRPQHHEIPRRPFRRGRRRGRWAARTCSQPIAFYQNAAGGVPGPFDSWLVLRGIKTLAVRMERHCANAQQLADWLTKQPSVQRVYYPGLPSHPGHELAKKQMRDFGGMITVSIKGGKDAALKFMTRTKLFSLAESLGGVESLDRPSRHHDARQHPRRDPPRPRHRRRPGPAERRHRGCRGFAGGFAAGSGDVSRSRRFHHGRIHHVIRIGPSVARRRLPAGRRGGCSGGAHSPAGSG